MRPRAVRPVMLRAKTGKSSWRLSSMSRAGPSMIDAGDAAHLRAERQVAAPARRVDAGALFARR